MNKIHLVNWVSSIPHGESLDMGTLGKKIGLFLLGGGGDGDDSDFREERGGIVDAKS